MNTIRTLFAGILLFLVDANGFAQGTAFTYQGVLSAAGSPASGQYEMTFTLFDAVTNGNVIGAGQTLGPVTVTNGQFTVALDFGTGAFTGAPRWLELSVNLFGSDMIPTTLTPRQPVLAAPYAIHAAQAAGLASSGNLPLEIAVNGQRALRLEPTSIFNPQVTGAPNLIGGSAANFITPDSTGSTIAGGGAVAFNGADNRNFIASSFATIGGGRSNTVDTQASGATIAGGSQNTIQSEGTHAVIGGGLLNWIAEDAGASTIAGGWLNRILGDGASIGGGYGNVAAGYATVAGGDENSVLGPYSAIGGGANNRIEPAAERSVIAGGSGNRISTNASSAAIGGGNANKIEPEAGTSVIAGGFDNIIVSHTSSIGGGRENGIALDSPYSTIGGGNGNGIATNSGSGTISGGSANSIIENSIYATIPGGLGNIATSYGFAAGRNAHAFHQGSFVWSDSRAPAFASVATNEFAVRATGGTRLVSAIDGDGVPVAGVVLGAGAGAWASLSDRNAKENFAPANSRDVLDRVAALPLMTWNYKSQVEAVRHLGPMAQDFRAAFGLGDSDRTITTVDADGVALAAIQGLNEKLEEALRVRDAEVRALKQAVEELKRLLEANPR